MYLFKIIAGRSTIKLLHIIELYNSLFCVCKFDLKLSMVMVGMYENHNSVAHKNLFCQVCAVK